MNPTNIKAIWIRCDNGKLSYEFELAPDVDAPDLIPNTNHIPVRDQTIIEQIEAKILDFDVSGARSRGIIVGEFLLQIGSNSEKILVMSTLEEWRDWLENRRLFRPRK
jgi:hypothetical protein